jgi:hypothetical protein
MERKTERNILILTFLIALGFRLAFIFRVPFFSSDGAYYNLRHAEHITHNLTPIIYDPLSYGGNLIVNTHLFHYFLAVWDLVLSQSIVYKLLPAILASSIVIIVYVLAKQITKDKYSALFGALLAAFVPTYISNTINQISVISVYIPVLLLLLSALLAIKKSRKLFLLWSIILVLLAPLNLLVLFTIVFFSILTLSESVVLTRTEKEASVFFVVFFVLINIVLFRTLYFDQSLAAIWQNLPLEVYGELFQNFNLFNTINLIGVVPLVFGIAGFILADKKNKSIILLKAVILADFTLLLLKLIPFQEGVLILAVIFCIISAITLKELIKYMHITKVAKYTTLFVSLIVLVSVVSLIIPSTSLALDVIEDGVTEGEIEAMGWIAQHTEEQATIAANINEGNMILYLAKRANVIDTNFLYAENRILDVEIIFTTQSLVLAKQALDTYSVNYIYFSEKTKEFYGVEALTYTNDESCFKEIFNNEQATIYEVVC